MGHKAAADRAAYFRDWKAGIRRTKVAEDGRRYIDGSMTSKMVEYDRAVRNRVRLRAQAKRDREEAAKSKAEWLRREIDRLKTAPFSWQREAQ